MTSTRDPIGRATVTEVNNKTADTHGQIKAGDQDYRERLTEALNRPSDFGCLRPNPTTSASPAGLVLADKK